MFDFFESAFIAIDRHDNHVVIVAVFLSLAALVLLLRMIAHLHFRGALIAFQYDARKEIKNRAEVGKLKNGLLRKAAAEYIRVAERAVTAVPTGKIVERQVAGLGLLGWRYGGLMSFVQGMETGFLWVGLIMTVIFSQYANVYGLLTVIVFALFRLAAAFFHVQGARAQLADEMVLFLERELGRFFVSDSGGAVLRLKNDLTEAIDRQSAAYKTTMESISRTMADAMTEVTSSMIAAANSIGPIVAKAMDEKLVNMNASLTSTLEDWERALASAAKVQTDMNNSSEKLSHAGGRIQSASELLATHMQGHSNALSEHLNALVSAIDELKAGMETLTARQDSLTKQTSYIERNQQTLEETLTAYEASLQKLTESLGDGLGAYVNLHAQASARTINDTMKANIDKIMHFVRGAKTGNE